MSEGEHPEDHPDAALEHADGGPDVEDEAWEPEEAADEEPITDKIDLRALADRLALERRRTTNGVLRMQKSAKEEVVLPLDRNETTIGRDPTCDIVLSQPGVSRRHAAIRRTETGYFELRDLRSTNGTRVQNDPIREMILLDKDRFRIGDVRFTLEIEAVEPAP